MVPGIPPSQRMPWPVINFLLKSEVTITLHLQLCFPRYTALLMYKETNPTATEEQANNQMEAVMRA